MVLTLRSRFYQLFNIIISLLSVLVCSKVNNLENLSNSRLKIPTAIYIQSRHLVSFRVYRSCNFIVWYLSTFLAEETPYYVSSYKGKDFRISTQPAEHSLYSEEFKFTLGHPQGNPNETPYFIYSQASDEQSFIQPKMDVLVDYIRFPLGVVVLDLNNQGLRRNSRRIHLIERSQNGLMISLDEHEIANCCKDKINFSFYGYNVTELGKRSKKKYVVN